jgi:NADPH:quinone reductase-like Zn-dependent oxidoreductase
MGTPNEYTRLKRVLILDGQGGLGTMAVQYCKQVLGMYVIAAANSTKSDCVKKLGADEVIDLSAVSTELIHPVDLVFDTRNGTFESCTDHSNMVTNGGWYLNVLSSPNTNKHAEQRGSLQLFLPDMQLYPLQFVSRLIHTQWNKLCQYFLSFSSPTLNEVVTHYRYICVHPNQTDLKELVAIMKAYQLRTVIDRVFPMTLEKVAHDFLRNSHMNSNICISRVTGPCSTQLRRVRNSMWKSYHSGPVTLSFLIPVILAAVNGMLSI